MGLFKSKRRRMGSDLSTLSEDAQFLLQAVECLTCHQILVDPITLSCGFTVCKECIQPPEKSGWPVKCPVQECPKKTHVASEICIDVTLSKLLDIVNTKIILNFNENLFPHHMNSMDDHLILNDFDQINLNDNDTWSEKSISIQTFKSTTTTCTNLSSASDESIQSSSREIQSIKEQKNLKDFILTELECQVCYLLFYDPITTPCGHTFCMSCIIRSLDHGDKCPLCRHTLPGFTFFNSHPINHLLYHILQSLFSNIYHERANIIQQEMQESLKDAPIFICQLSFPKMPVFLHIFEPRYRLMLRRCLKSNKRFGIVLPARTGGGACLEYGTMLEIRSVDMLPDGRSVIETIGSFRFRLLERAIKDGYTVGKIERIDDISQEEEMALEEQDLAQNENIISHNNHNHNNNNQDLSTSNRNIIGRDSNISFSSISSNRSSSESSRRSKELPTSELIRITRDFIEALRSGSTPWLQQRLNATYGNMPEDLSDFSFWVASVMPIDEFEKAKLLPIRSVRLRLKLIVCWISQLQQQWWFHRGCNIH